MTTIAEWSPQYNVRIPQINAPNPDTHFRGNIAADGSPILDSSRPAEERSEERVPGTGKWIRDGHASPGKSLLKIFR